MPASIRHCFSILTAALLLVPSAFAVDVPLSDEAVREAYFLGQRHDESVASFLNKYIKHLPPPKTGPYISSVAFLTPFAQIAELSNHQAGNYSAQQAELDHRGQKEIVRVIVEIQYTPTYGAFLAPQAGSDSNSALASTPRPKDSWRDFQVQIYDDQRILTPSDSHSRVKHNCGRYGPCSPVGVSLEFDFPSEAFRSDSETIVVLPPEGSPVSVDFNRIALR